MKRILVRASIVGPGRLWLDVNWYDPDTLEQGGTHLTYEDSGGTSDMLYSNVNAMIAQEVGGAPENIIWI